MRWPVRISQPGSGGGGPPGSSEDRFAPKYLVGNTGSGDPDTSSIAGLAAGFNYYPDSGNGAQLQQALLAADSNAGGVTGDVWIRPGIYIISSTLNVPTGVQVRGAGTGATYIIAADGTINGALFNLADGSSLRDMSVVHSQPTAVNVPTEGCGVVQVKDATAYCENIVVTSDWSSPTNTTLRGCFYVFSTDSLQLKASLKCINCSTSFRRNTGNDYKTNLVGYRSANSDIELLNCSSFALGTLSAPITPGYNVIVLADEASGLISVTIRGGTYEAFYGCIYVEADNTAYNRFLCSDVTASGGKDPSGGGSVGIGSARYFNAGIVNCDVFMEQGNGPPCVGFYPQPTSEQFNTGRVIGCRMNGGANSYPWYSLVTAGVSGYHTFIGNTYQASMLAPFIGVNDEVAHNIAVP